MRTLVSVQKVDGGFVATWREGELLFQASQRGADGWVLDGVTSLETSTPGNGQLVNPADAEWLDSMLPVMRARVEVAQAFGDLPW